MNLQFRRTFSNECDISSPPNGRHNLCEMVMPNSKLKEIQKRLVSAITYYRILNRFSLNEITEKTGINFYLIEGGTRPVSIATIIKLESVFGPKAISNLLNHAWHGEEEWSEEALEKRIRYEQEQWDKEKKSKKEKAKGKS